MATANETQTLYITYFGRPADPEGLQFWLQDTSTPLAGIADGFATTPEYAATTAGKTVSQIINIIYQNLFCRKAYASGLSFWTGNV
ncbi:MAG: DUF4214 domain-containing protein, partial [Synechococcaceae cyanobacterium]